MLWKIVVLYEIHSKKLQWPNTFGTSLYIFIFQSWAGFGDVGHAVSTFILCLASISKFLHNFCIIRYWLQILGYIFLDLVSKMVVMYRIWVYNEKIFRSYILIFPGTVNAVVLYGHMQANFGFLKITGLKFVFFKTWKVFRKVVPTNTILSSKVSQQLLQLIRLPVCSELMSTNSDKYFFKVIKLFTW